MRQAAAHAGGDAAGQLAGLIDAVDALAATVLSGAVDDLQLTRSVAVIRRVEAMLAGERLRRVAEVDERRAYRAVGAGSTETWIAESQWVARPDAAAEVVAALALRELPETARLLARGDIGEATARVAARAWREVSRESGAFEDDPPPEDEPGEDSADDSADDETSPADDEAEAAERAARAEAQRQARARARERERQKAREQAREKARADFDRMMGRHGRHANRQKASQQARRWRDGRDAERGISRARRAHERRDLWIADRRDSDGSTVFSGRLDDTGAATLRAAIDAASRPADDADRSGERRTPGQRRADALVGLAEGALNGGTLPNVTRQRPHVILVLTPEGLHGLKGAPAPYLDGVGEIAPETARMICCDASIAPVTIRNGDVLDAGPRQQEVSARQRDAVLARDRRCVGCGARAARSQIHHITWRSRGGKHDIGNLVLVCFDCHFHLHHHGWEVARHADGSYRLRRPGALGEDAGGDVGGTSSERHAGPGRTRPDQAASRDPEPEAAAASAGDPSAADASAAAPGGSEISPEGAQTSGRADRQAPRPEPPAPPVPGGPGEPRVELAEEQRLFREPV